MNGPLRVLDGDPMAVRGDGTKGAAQESEPGQEHLRLLAVVVGDEIQVPARAPGEECSRRHGTVPTWFRFARADRLERAPRRAVEVEDAGLVREPHLATGKDLDRDRRADGLDAPELVL